MHWMSQPEGHAAFAQAREMTPAGPQQMGSEMRLLRAMGYEGAAAAVSPVHCPTASAHRLALEDLLPGSTMHQITGRQAVFTKVAQALWYIKVYIVYFAAGLPGLRSASNYPCTTAPAAAGAHDGGASSTQEQCEAARLLLELR